MAFPNDDAFYSQSSGLKGLMSHNNILLFTILLSVGSGFFILMYNGSAMLLLILLFSSLGGSLPPFVIIEVISTPVFAVVQILSGYGIHKQLDWSRNLGIITGISIIIVESILLVSIGDAFIVFLLYRTEIGIIALNVILLVLLNTQDVKNHLGIDSPENEHTYSY